MLPHGPQRKFSAVQQHCGAECLAGAPVCQADSLPTCSTPQSQKWLCLSGAGTRRSCKQRLSSELCSNAHVLRAPRIVQPAYLRRQLPFESKTSSCWLHLSITSDMLERLRHTYQGALPALSQPDGMKVRSGLLRLGSPRATAASWPLIGCRGVLWAPQHLDMLTAHWRALQEMPEKLCSTQLLCAEHVERLCCSTPTQTAVLERVGAERYNSVILFSTGPHAMVGHWQDQQQSAGSSACVATPQGTLTRHSCTECTPAQVAGGLACPFFLLSIPGLDLVLRTTSRS